MAKNYTNPLDEYYDLIGKQAGQQTSSDPLEEYYRLVSGDTTAKQLEQNAAGGMLERRYNHWANAENRYMQMVRNFNTSISDRINAGNQGVYQNKKTYEQAEREINYYKWVDEAMKRYRQGMPDRLESGFSPEIDKAYQDEFTKQSQGLGFEEYLNAISDAVTSQREYYGQFRDAGDYNRQRMVAGQQPQLPDKGYKWWEEALRTPGSQAQTYEQMQDKPDGRRFDGPDSKRYQESQDKLGDLFPGETPPIDDKKEPGAVLPDGTRRIASTGVSDVVYQQRGPRVLPDAVKHPDLQGVSLMLDPQNRPLDKQISYLEELKRWQTGQVTQPDLKKMAAEKLLPGMGKYKLEGMGGAEIKGILETEKNKLASGNGNPHMVQGIKDYYYNNTSQGTRDYITEITPRVAELNAELERLRYAEVDIIYKMDSGSMAGQEGVEAIYANSERLAQVTTELERLSTLANVILPIQETYLRLKEENAELRKDPDFLAKTFFDPEKGYDAVLAKALDDTDFYSQMEWRDKLPNSTAEYIYQSIAGKMNADPNALGYDDNYALAAGHADIEGRGLDKLTPDEKHTFLYKYNVQGPAKAMAYLDDLGDVLLYRRAIDNEEAWRAFASKNGWTATLATVASVPLNMVNAVMSPVRMVHAATGGSPFDRVMDTQRMTNVYREEGAKMLGGAIDFVIPGINKNAGELIYGVATSMADMWAAAGLGAMVGAPNAVSFILGSSAASATLLSAMESGKNPGQAVAQSFLAGAIEVATEAISWSKLNKLGYAAKKSMMQNVARNIAVQAATEGMEEGFSAVGNMAVSVLMYGLERSDFGDLQKAVQADALKAGETLTEDQVFTRALLRFAQDMGGDILAGMMSGGLNAAGMMAFSQEHRSDLVGKYINDQKGIVHETAAKVDLYGGERIRDAGRAVEEKIWGRPVSEMTLEERRAEMNQIEKRLRKGAATMTTQEQVDTSRRLNELTDYSTLPEQQAQTRGMERAEEAQLPPQIETREERMAKVEELSRYEAENTERLTPQEKRQIAQQMKTLMADVDSLPTLKQANIQAQQAAQARLDDIIAKREESKRGRIEAEAKLGRVKQNAINSQLSRSAQQDARVAEAQPQPTQEEDQNLHAARLLQERMDAIRALPEERMGTQEVRQELQDITAELDRLEPRKAPERPQDPASEAIAMPPVSEAIEPRKAPERPQDPASEAIAMPPVSEAIEPRKAPERPQDPAAERIESEPQTGTGYTGLAREYGMAGLRTSDLESVIGKDNLTDEVLQAHKEGVSQAKVEARMRTEEILGRREAASKRGYLKSISEQEAAANGVNTIGKMSPAIRKASTALRVIAESTGINVVLFESPINDKGEHTGKQAWFDSAKRTIYLDVKAGYGNEEATMRAAGHELTHVIQKFAPEFYENTYKPAVIDALYEGNEGTVLDLVQEQIRIAKENGKTMTESQAMFEVIADASERMLMGDQATITGLVEQNPDLFKRVKNWIDNFVNSLRRAYTILKADSSAAKVLEGTYERFKGIQEMWWNGLQDAALNIRGQQEAMPISAYEQSRDAAREAKLQRIGAGLINPAMYEPVDYRQYAPKPQAKPIEPTIRQWEAFEKAKAEDDFGGMFAAAIDEEAIENMTPEDLDALLSLPGADKLAEEGKKTTPTTAKKPDKVLSDGVVPVDKLKGLPVKFRNLVKKWAGNEYVNVDINDTTDQDAQNFVDWAKKWYNYGREGNWPELGIFDDNDLNFPPFLQNTFFNQGKADAEQAIKPVKAGGETDVRGTEDHDTGGIPEVEERLPGQGQADEPSTGETVGAGPQAGGVLEEVSSEDVQQPGGPGGTARDSDGGIRPAVRDDVTTDAPGSTRGPGVGSGERGNLRNPSRDINDDVVQAAAEAAKRREAEANKGKNYVIPPEGLDLPGGQKTRFNLNVEAIKIAKALEAEGRIATPEEQQALARYVGWGGIPDAFDARGRVKEGWEAENQTLKELLSEEEYDAARRSTTNAHYTEIGIIRSMYDALKKWGFKGGYVLEPSSGIGNFIGAAPSFGKQARWTAVELDSTTALIAKHLYPQASVHHAGFQDVQLPDNYFDLAISNVPFSETGPVDKKYPKFLRSNLHNYFFVKSMDKVRPGGLVMFITSRFTMDSANSSFREYMARHADLVGAVRLPDTAFKQNANTEVVTDLLVFKKRQPNTEYTGQPFAHAGVQIFDSPHTSYGARHNVNEYFLNNPDMVLGTPTISRGMYSANTLTYKAIEGKALTEQLSEALSKINVKVDYVERTADPMKAADEVVKASSRTKNNGYEVKDGKVYQNNNGTLALADDINQSPDKLARVTTMLGLRDLRKQLLHAQLQGKEKAETDRLRKELNKQYDAFVKKHGFLNSKKNARLMYDDPDSFSLLALEDYRPAEDGKPEQAIKTDIFVKDIIASATRATSAKNPEEALAISINELGYLDPERMGELLSVTPDQAEALLLEQQLAFKDEDGALIPAPVYLSGRVRSKLIIAKQMAAVDKSYQANVEALESVIPADVPVEDISMPLGATWIPTEYYEGFIRHILHLPTYKGKVKVQMNPLTSSYKIELNSAAKRSIDRRADIKYGAGDWSFLKILDKIMNGGSMKPPKDRTALNRQGHHRRHQRKSRAQV